MVGELEIPEGTITSDMPLEAIRWMIGWDWVEMGDGSERMVFELSRDHVIKVPHRLCPRANEEEIMVWKQRIVGSGFERFFTRPLCWDARDFTWVVYEKVEVGIDESSQDFYNLHEIARNLDLHDIHYGNTGYTYSQEPQPVILDFSR